MFAAAVQHRMVVVEAHDDEVHAFDYSSGRGTVGELTPRGDGFRAHAVTYTRAVLSVLLRLRLASL